MSLFLYPQARQVRWYDYINIFKPLLRFSFRQETCRFCSTLIRWRYWPFSWQYVDDRNPYSSIGYCSRCAGYTNSNEPEQTQTTETSTLNESDQRRIIESQIQDRARLLLQQRLHVLNEHNVSLVDAELLNASVRTQAALERLDVEIAKSKSSQAKGKEAENSESTAEMVHNPIDSIDLE